MSKRAKIIFLCLFILGAGIRALDVTRPLDGSIRECWRELDVASIARNYYREDMNLFYPRVDWRGDRPGYVEMEFPVCPWVIAILYRIFGFHEMIGRIVVYIFSIITLIIFFRLARYLLPESGAISASLFFIFSPLVMRMSNRLQPEGLMFLFYVLGAFEFIRWLDDNSWKHYIVSLVATSLSILCKASAAHIGLFFMLLIAAKRGIKGFGRGAIWVFGLGALLPGVLWYTHARNLWLTYGNSLGLSNETHWAGLDIFTDPQWLLGIAQLEVVFVWMPAGLVLAGLAVLLRRSDRVVRYSLFWLLSIFIFYLLAARSAAKSWSVYYHVVSVVPVSLLIGAGVSELLKLKFEPTMLAASGKVLGIAGVMLGGVGVFRLAGPYSAWGIKVSLLFLMAAFFLLIWLYCERKNYVVGEKGLTRHKLLNALILCTITLIFSATILMEIQWVRYDIVRPGYCNGMYKCAEAFSPFMKENGLIVTSGGGCRDEEGYIHAVNAPYMFYWLDRKGFNICHEEQSIETVKSFSTRGAKYYIAEKPAVSLKPGFEFELKREFRLADECDEAFLFDLTSAIAK